VETGLSASRQADWRDQTFSPLTDGGTVASAISTHKAMFSIEDECF
jgi:hypothetical protein